MYMNQSAKCIEVCDLDKTFNKGKKSAKNDQIYGDVK